MEFRHIPVLRSESIHSPICRGFRVRRSESGKKRKKSVMALRYARSVCSLYPRCWPDTRKSFMRDSRTLTREGISRIPLELQFLRDSSRIEQKLAVCKVFLLIFPAGREINAEIFFEIDMLMLREAFRSWTLPVTPRSIRANHGLKAPKPVLRFPYRSEQRLHPGREVPCAGKV